MVHTIGRMRTLAAALVMAALPAAAAAQYFGENKVQYRPLHFRHLPTEHFDIYFRPEQREAVDIAARLAERSWQRLSRFFDHQLHGRQPLVLYASHVDFEQTLIVPTLVDAGTVGFTESRRRRMALAFGGPLARTERVIAHELAHAFQFDLWGRSSSPYEEPHRGELPLWFVEGLAEYLSVGGVDAHTAMWLRDATRQNDLPGIEELEAPQYFAYRWGHAFWAHVAGKWGEGSAARLFVVASRTGVAAAIERVLGTTPPELVSEWHGAIRDAYLERPEGTAPVGVPIIGGSAFGPATNVGPAISPDGRWLAFLSGRGTLSADLFVADAASGDVVARLTHTATDARYSSLQLMESAAAWDRDGRRLAVGTVKSGRATISVFGWPAGKRLFDVVIEEVDEIYSPTWSPDGRFIAFSALANGVTDLFVYDLARRRLRRLTDDPFADMQPAWEPEGQRLAFATDRFTTDPDALAFGPLRLALVDVVSGAIADVPGFATGKHISPQWSPDGRSLYFVSDCDGTSNLYRVELATSVTTRLSVTITGLSGMSALSPVLSVAAREATVAVTVYEYGRFAIHTLIPADDPLAEADLRGRQIEADGQLATLPTLWSRSASKEHTPSASYKPRLAFEGTSEATLPVGIDRLGATRGAGLGVAFTDILNTRWLVAAVQVNDGLEHGLRDMGAYGAHFARVHRWNWGVIGSVMPSTAVLQHAGGVRPVRQTESAGAALAAYPFNRARRVELHGGISRLAFDSSAVGSFTAGTTSIALVSDETVAGPTSVVIGERYRMEVAPTFGPRPYVNVLADYRRYLMPLPFYTIAARALYVGRYGDGGGDPRLPPLHAGSPALVRGYDLGAQIEHECVNPALAGCQQVEHMLGSRMAVGNVEVRFPLLRPFGLSSRMYGPIPMEVALFLDGGRAWSNAGQAARGDTTPGGILSTGVTLRTNVLGLGLAQFHVARRLALPGAGWTFQFHLAAPL